LSVTFEGAKIAKTLCGSKCLTYTRPAWQPKGVRRTNNDNSMNVLITGGTGLIGKRLSAMLLEKGYSVSFLSRGKTDISGTIKTYHWNPEKGELDDTAIRNAHAIINLAGASIADGRWTAKRKNEIYTSRTAGTMLLAHKLKELNHPLKVFVNASAVGFYGDKGGKWLTETDNSGNDFLASVCKDWEAKAQTVSALGIRTVICRIGIVLAREGGALPELEKSMRFGISAYLGDGRQYYSWIHLDDVCRIFIHALENEKMNGAYNAVGNNPVTNKELLRAIQKAKGAHALTVTAPAFALKIILGEMSEAILGSQRCVNEKLGKLGFEFRFTNLQNALSALYA